MGSFQQIVMGVTCLAAAFFFGSYLHNRPAENQKIADSHVPTADPLDSLFGLGKRPANQNANSVANQLQPQRVAQQPSLQTQGVTQLPASPSLSAIDPSELAPQVTQRSVEQSARSVVPAAARKPVVPDFSELASRFRNTPLELDGATTSEANTSVHETERVPWSGVFKAPEMVIRQPENTQPSQDLKNQVDRVEDAIRNEFAATAPKETRWRVNRSDKVDRFPNEVRQRPQQDLGPRETIDDVLSRRSADWLKQDEPVEQTWATNPPQQGWMSQQRREVTQKAAKRSQDILEVEDPGNRFQSVMNEVEEISSPQPDFDTSYYTPTKQRQDSMAPPAPTTQLQNIQGGNSDNWSRQSNIQSSVLSRPGNRYEGQRGDTLQSISMKFFGTPARYLEIYKANRQALDRITSSLEGVILEIPNVNN